MTACISKQRMTMENVCNTTALMSSLRYNLIAGM